MKNLLFATLLLLTSMVCAQTEKGNWLLGGSTILSFNSVNTKVEVDQQEIQDVSNSIFTFGGEGGYFVSNNLMVGLNLLYLNQSDNDSPLGSTSFSVAPGIQYYFDTGSEFKPYLGARVGYQTETESNFQFADDDFDFIIRDFTYSGLTYGLRAGVAYFINSSLSVDFRMDYAGASLSYSENDNVKRITNNLGVGLGFFLYL